jgi:hypothetical protein
MELWVPATNTMIGQPIQLLTGDMQEFLSMKQRPSSKSA